ncbi:sulfotransferase [Mycolicibacter sp. MYC123]|uniref:Sulfotransferase n=1 Tax=[Mycobacterium] zoologicum TaxID=2872311 RepID=A0ABU5YI38_9MYCO|nr:sulfotransferase [Mycolicibacter sp. MYC123]MEB3049480.1 sulfotransferase [Mycolicibacter sp. MYC123]
MNENEELIRVLYNGMLKRAPSEKEFKDWVEVLESGKSPAAVAAAFYNSSEYRDKNEIKPAYGKESDQSGLVQQSDSKDSPVFIVGSARSGTSALAHVLWDIGYHGKGEGHFLTLLRGIDTVVDQHYARVPATDPGVTLGNIDKSDLKRKLFETFRTVMNDLNPKKPWFDKTPNLEMIWVIPILRELWPSSVFVFAKRRGIENVISRTKKFPGMPFENHCADWAGNMTAWRTIRPQLPPECFIEVEQRDMIQQPERTARNLCAFLQVDESAVPGACRVMSTPGSQESEKGSASRTLSLAESGWTVEQTETFLKHCESEMKEFGYTMDEHYSITP